MEEGQNAAGDVLDSVPTNFASSLHATGAASGAIVVIGIILSLFACVLCWGCFRLYYELCAWCIGDCARFVCCCCPFISNRRKEAALNEALWRDISHLRQSAASTETELAEELPDLIQLVVKTVDQKTREIDSKLLDQIVRLEERINKLTTASKQ
jgi:hypothetical protein